MGVAQVVQAEVGPPSGPPAGRNTEVGWHGQKRSKDTHASTSAPEARLYRESNNTAATLRYAGHQLIEHRSALIVDAELTCADGYAERATALEMLDRLPTTKRRRTVAGDKNCDTKDFVARNGAATLSSTSVHCQPVVPPVVVSWWSLHGSRRREPTATGSRLLNPPPADAFTRRDDPIIFLESPATGTRTHQRTVPPSPAAARSR